MPPEDEIKQTEETVEVTEEKKNPLVKYIIFGVAGFFLLLGGLVIVMVIFLKPDEGSLDALQGTASADSSLTDSIRVTVGDMTHTGAVLPEESKLTAARIVEELKALEKQQSLEEEGEDGSSSAEKEKVEEEKPFEPPAQVPSSTVQAQSPVTQEVDENFAYRRLAKIYAVMKPADAAKIMDKMETGLVVSVLSNMKDRNAAKILSALSPEKAARISRVLSRVLSRKLSKS